mgnify:CR=1 FL=1|tara:strand:- start:3574 stop:4350 length:777 start_codon:yes stop_codon:yes gene_type:complete
MSSSTTAITAMSPPLNGNESSPNNHLKDGMTLELLNECLDLYIDHYNHINVINSKLKNKKCRHNTFPSPTSENICKFAIYKKYGYMPNWDIKPGDLGYLDKKIEVKGFMSDGPTSFGPTEKWDILYFVDAKQFLNKIFKVYEVKLSDNSERWNNIEWSGINFDTNCIPDLPNNLKQLTKTKLKELCKERGLVIRGNKDELITRLKTKEPGSKYKKVKTYGDYKSTGKRPHACFYNKIKPQIEDVCVKIFDGHFSELYI